MQAQQAVAPSISLSEVETVPTPAAELGRPQNGAPQIPISLVFLPAEPRLDTILGYSLLRFAGQSAFPGIDAAQLQFSQGGFYETDSYYDRAGYLPINIGCGRFDPAPMYGNNSKKPHRGTASALVAKYLRIHTDRKYKDLLNEVAEFTKPETFKSQTQLGALILMAYQYNGDNTRVLKWAMEAFQAIVHWKQWNHAPIPYKSVSRWLKEQLHVGNYKDDSCPQATTAVENFLLASEARQHGSLTELASIAETMQRIGKTTEEVEAWLEFIMSIMFTQQLDFHDQLAQAKALRPIIIKGQCGRRVRDCNLLVIESDSPQAAKATQFLGADITVIVRSTGHKHVFTHKKSKIQLANLVRMLRWYTLPEHERARYNWSDLGNEKLMAELVPNWGLLTEIDAVLNSCKIGEARPTDLYPQALIELCKFAFTHEGVRSWCHDRGIRFAPKSTATKRPVKIVVLKKAATAEVKATVDKPAPLKPAVRVRKVKAEVKTEAKADKPKNPKKGSAAKKRATSSRVVTK